MENDISFERIRALFSAVEDNRKGRCGRPEKIPAGSEAAERLRELILRDAEHQDMTWPEVAKELGLDACRSTIERVVHQHLNIHRYTPRLKPPLTNKDKGERVEFAQWVLIKLTE